MVECVVVASRAVKLGNIGVAIVWTILLTVVLIAFVVFLGRRSKHSLIEFFCSKDRKLSLARTQVTMWTVVYRDDNRWFRYA